MAGEEAKREYENVYMIFKVRASRDNRYTCPSCRVSLYHGAFSFTFECATCGSVIIPSLQHEGPALLVATVDDDE